MNEPKSRAPTANCVAFPSAQHKTTQFKTHRAAANIFLAVFFLFAFVTFCIFTQFHIESNRMIRFFFLSLCLWKARKAHTCVVHGAAYNSDESDGRQRTQLKFGGWVYFGEKPENRVLLSSIDSRRIL